MVRLNINQVTYLEIQGHNLIVHSSNKDYLLRSTLKEMEAKLNAAEFVRCNSCYLVNLSYVEAVRDNQVIVAGRALQMSRSRKKAFKDALTNYLGGK